MNRSPFLFLFGLAVASGALLACGGSHGTTTADGAAPDATTPPEAGTDSTISMEASGDAISLDDASDAGDAGLPGDAEGGAPADGPPVYNDITSGSNWSAFDTTTVNPNAFSDFGAAFDGRYVYFAPYDGRIFGYGSIVSRYDTQAPFGTAASWSTFDTTTVTANAQGFAGAAFDGRYVYLVPNGNGSGAAVVSRYDTQASFTSGSSWSTFDTTGANANATGFAGASFDGRYVYLVPTSGVSGNGIAARYDTQASFTVKGSWATFDTTMLGGAANFTGGVFDGRYLYLVPATDGAVAQYDTQGTFTAKGSWASFDATTVNANAQGFFGGAFDGRFVYFVPSSSNGSQDGIVTRYDSKAAFATTGSWSTFDTTGVNLAAKGFAGGAFDGRYVYLSPNGGDIKTTVARCDTLSVFADAGAWTTFDIKTVDAGSSGIFGFRGAVFDGEYLYFVPVNGVVARFDARSPPSLPALPGFHGSFL